ncbi:MAG: tocopherol cyclase family protein [Anaerolineae bacterium]|nr:tocopherol cyclase family protein [Anaerolineae bacterium]
MKTRCAVLDPDRYHGHGQKPPFFEGWYYKLVDAAENVRYAIIPGIFLSDEPSAEHAFIQVLNGTTGEASYHRYPAPLFWAARDRFDIRIGPNHFNTQVLEVAIDDDQLSLHGRIHFSGIKPWPVSLLAPGIMGWYAWVPFMETYHGVVSLDHTLHGTLVANGQPLSFDGGRGYVEKDWGASFPAGYVWTQCNHFETPGTSLTASAAIIPWLTGAFGGFIAGLRHQGRLYRFATYTGARSEGLEVDDQQVSWVMGDRYRRLRLTARRERGGLIYGPSRTDMSRRIGETMLATVEVYLQEWRQRERLLFRGSGRNAGLEVHGDITRLITMLGS